MDCYDDPVLWDRAFADETTAEADFITAMHDIHCPTLTRQVLEIGCGGGRQVLEMTRRGFAVTAIDLNAKCVSETQRRIRRSGRTARVLQADMSQFELPQKFALAHCLVNTFRHLLSEHAARQHLECVARALLPGGVYLLGFHLLPPDALELDCERWTVLRRGERITTTVRVLEFSRRKRIERVRFSLCQTRGENSRRIAADYRLRIYKADQFRRLLSSVPLLELLQVCDFCYEPTDNFPLTDELGDAVFVLRRRTTD